MVEISRVQQDDRWAVSEIHRLKGVNYSDPLDDNPLEAAFVTSSAVLARLLPELTLRRAQSDLRALGLAEWVPSTQEIEVWLAAAAVTVRSHIQDASRDLSSVANPCRFIVNVVMDPPDLAPFRVEPISPERLIREGTIMRPASKEELPYALRWEVKWDEVLRAVYAEHLRNHTDSRGHVDRKRILTAARSAFDDLNERGIGTVRLVDSNDGWHPLSWVRESSPLADVSRVLDGRHCMRVMIEDVTKECEALLEIDPFDAEILERAEQLESVDDHTVFEAVLASIDDRCGKVMYGFRVDHLHESEGDTHISRLDILSPQEMHDRAVREGLIGDVELERAILLVHCRQRLRQGSIMPPAESIANLQRQALRALAVYEERDPDGLVADGISIDFARFLADGLRRHGRALIDQL